MDRIYKQGDGLYTDKDGRVLHFDEGSGKYYYTDGAECTMAGSGDDLFSYSLEVGDINIRKEESTFRSGAGVTEYKAETRCYCSSCGNPLADKEWTCKYCGHKTGEVGQKFNIFYPLPNHILSCIPWILFFPQLLIISILARLLFKNKDTSAGVKSMVILSIIVTIVMTILMFKFISRALEEYTESTAETTNVSTSTGRNRTIPKNRPEHMYEGYWDQLVEKDREFWAAYEDVLDLRSKLDDLALQTHSTGSNSDLKPIVAELQAESLEVARILELAGTYCSTYKLGELVQQYQNGENISTGNPHTDYYTRACMMFYVVEHGISALNNFISYPELDYKYFDYTLLSGLEYDLKYEVEDLRKDYLRYKGMTDEEIFNYELY